MVAALQINQLIKVVINAPGALFRQYKKTERINFSTVYLTEEIYTKVINSEILNYKNLKCVSCGTTKVEIMFAPQIIKHRQLVSETKLSGEYIDDLNQ